MKRRAFWGTIILTLVLVISSLWWSPTAAAFTEEERLLLQSWRIVNQAYLDESFNHQNWWLLRQKFLKKPLSNREETYETIEEMLATLDDPYTRFLRPQQYRTLQVNTSGELSGVGLQIHAVPELEALEVISPLAGSPAEAAGIEPRDLILAIDEVPTANLSLDEAAARMRGQVGTRVALTVKKMGEVGEPVEELELIRDRISLNPVYATLDDRTGIPVGYLRLNQFSANAATEIAHAVDKLETQGAEGYILDLRNNPGGLLQAGIEIARLWLDDATIVYTVNRQGMLGDFNSDNPALTEDPLIVLVNGGTASSSEILAGALQDNDRALLVGEKTFGKGLIQSLFELPHGAGLAVTVAKYETPNHKDINKLGIMPDRVVPQDQLTFSEIATEDDLQYQTAIQILTGDSVIANAA